MRLAAITSYAGGGTSIIIGTLTNVLKLIGVIGLRAKIVKGIGEEQNVV